jgi:hypothetical protein
MEKSKNALAKAVRPGRMRTAKLLVLTVLRGAASACRVWPEFIGWWTKPVIGKILRHLYLTNA